MLGGRFLPMLAALAIAGSLAGKRVSPTGLGTLRTDTPTFVVVLIAVILIVALLTFVPALLLGPVVQGLTGPALLAMREIRAAAIALVALSLVFGLAYPLAMTGVGQAVFGGAADGSIVKRDGKAVGSKLIGQDFSRDLRYFQSRPSATEYSASATFFNNLGPNQQDLADAAEGQRQDLPRPRAAHHAGPARRARSPPTPSPPRPRAWTPTSRRTTRASRPTASPERRGLGRARVLALVDEHTSHPLLGLAGEGSVNVLELNLALDRESTPMTDRPERSLLQRDILVPRDRCRRWPSSTRGR